MPEGAQREDAEAEITLSDDAPGQPIRRTISLGFIGDNKLTETSSHGGPWNAPDALLPIHQHGGGSYYGGGGSYYRGGSSYPVHSGGNGHGGLSPGGRGRIR